MVRYYLLLWLFPLFIALCSSQTMDFVWQLQVEGRNGTCFFICKDGYALTAAHNFWDGKKNGGLMHGLKSKKFKIRHPNFDIELDVKVIDILCDKFFENDKLCDKADGNDVALIRLVNVEDKNILANINIPEMAMHLPRAKTRLSEAQIIGYAASKNPFKIEPIVGKNFQVADFQDDDVKGYLRTGTSIWYSKYDLYNQIQGGFSGSPLVATGTDLNRNLIEIYGITTMVFRNRTFAEVVKDIYGLLLKVDLKDLNYANKIYRSIAEGNKGAIKEINNLTRLESMILLENLSKENGVSSSTLCSCYFFAKEHKELHFGYMERMLIDLFDSEDTRDICKEQVDRIGDIADLLLMNYKKFRDTRRILSDILELYGRAEDIEVDKYNTMRRARFFQSYASAADKYASEARDANYRTIAIEKILKAGDSASKSNQDIVPFTMDASHLYAKIGKYQDSFDFLKLAYKSSEEQTLRLSEDIRFVKGKIDNRTYMDGNIHLIMSDSDLSTGLDHLWLSKLEEIQGEL